MKAIRASLENRVGKFETTYRNEVIDVLTRQIAALNEQLAKAGRAQRGCAQAAHQGTAKRTRSTVWVGGGEIGGGEIGGGREERQELAPDFGRMEDQHGLLSMKAMATPD